MAKLTEKVEAAVNIDTLQNAKRFPLVGQEFVLATATAEKPLAESLVQLATDERTLQLKIVSIGKIAPDGIGIEAIIQDDQLHTEELGVNSLYIPLWCRPALTFKAADGYCKIWEPSDSLPAIMSGHFCPGYTYDIEGDPPLLVTPNYRDYNDLQQYYHHDRKRKESRDRNANWPYNANKRRKRQYN